MVSAMETLAARAESVPADFTLLSMCFAYVQSTVGALGISRAPTRCPECILQAPDFDYAAVAHLEKYLKRNFRNFRYSCGVESQRTVEYDCGA